MKHFILASLSFSLLFSTACGQNRPSAAIATPASKLAALDKAYQAGVLSKDEYEAKKRELAPAPAADPARMSALDTAYQTGVLTKEEYEAKKRGLTAAPVATPKADPVQLSAIETAYRSGVLSKEEYDARRQELEQSGTATAPVTAAVAQPGGWSRSRDPHGFDIEYPAGWTTQVSNDMRIVVRSQDGASIATVMPFVKAGASCRQYLTEALAGGGLFPQARIDNATQRRQQPDEVVAAFTFDNGRARGAALCSLYRGSGMMFAIAAPAGSYDRQKEDLARIVRSVSFRQPASGTTSNTSGAASRAVQYARFTDPREGAFIVDVPAGWRTEGGLLRRSAIDITGSIRTSSPDGATGVFLGDERLSNCVTPEVMGGSMREGQIYDSGAGTRLMILRMQPPAVFGMNYLGQLQQRYGLSGIQVKDRRDRSDLVAAANRNAAQFNANPQGPTRSSSAEVSFTAQRNGRPVAGYLLVSIAVTPWMNNGVYWTPSVSGYVTPMDDLGQTNAIFWHSLNSAEMNPQWTQGQQKTTMATSKIFAAGAEANAETISKSYWANQAIHDRTMQNDSDARRDQVRLRDPNTGEEFTAAAGHNYYYRPAAGDGNSIFGTNNTDRPNIDASELLIVH